MFTDTIFALSSGRLPSGVAVVRLSGNRCRFVCETFTGGLPDARRASLRELTSRRGERLDTGIVLWFPSPESFTGEDCLEFHLHGSVAVVRAVLDELGSCQGLRQADPGEFTRRAFINGKLDLVQAEALSDLISAETEAQRRFAVLNGEGRQSALYASWRERLLSARAAIEAGLDFSDEGDVPDTVGQGVWDDLEHLLVEMVSHCRGYKRAEMIRDGFDVVLAGAPNAGKSSLINILAKREVAIVSPEAGTTRDLIEVNLDLDGYKVRVTDTAGLRNTEHDVERIGVERARERLADADLVLLLTDMSAPVEVGDVRGESVIRIGTKADLVENHDKDEFDICLSSLHSSGVAELLEIIAERVVSAASGTSDIMPSQLRHVALIREACDHIQKAEGLSTSPELMAEQLRLACNSLARITGEIDVEDVLDSIFSRFCIGK